MTKKGIIPEMPVGMNPIHLPRLYTTGLSDTIEICAPLIPTQNTWDRLHWATRRRFAHNVCYPLLRDQVDHLLGRRRVVPWFQKARLSVVRCSNATVKADPFNLTAALKGLIDLLQIPALVKANNPTTGLGLIFDDSSKYLEKGEIKDEPKGHWTKPGPGTWLIITRIK